MRRVPGILLLLALASAALLAAAPAAAQEDARLVLRSVAGPAWADEAGQRNPLLTVAPGAKVVVRVVNDDGGFHNLQVDGNPPSEYVQEKGAELLYPFTAPASGELGYRCPVHPDTMKGTIRVQGEGSPPPRDGVPGAGVAGALAALALAAGLLARRG